MAVAYPIAIGIALVDGVLINNLFNPNGAPLLIFICVACVAFPIVLDAFACHNPQADNQCPKQVRMGILLALSGGILMGLLYFSVQRCLSPDFDRIEPGKFGP